MPKIYQTAFCGICHTFVLYVTAIFFGEENGERGVGELVVRNTIEIRWKYSGNKPSKPACGRQAR